MANFLKSNRSQQFFSVPQHAWIDEDNAKNARHNQEFQYIMKQYILFFGVGFPKILQEENQNDKTAVKIEIHIAHVENFDQYIDRYYSCDSKNSDYFLGNVFAINYGNGFVIVRQITFDIF